MNIRCECKLNKFHWQDEINFKLLSPPVKEVYTYTYIHIVIPRAIFTTQSFVENADNRLLHLGRELINDSRLRMH